MTGASSPLEAGIEPRFEQFNGRDPLAFVVSLNLARRHLSESQRAVVGAKIASLRDGQRQVGQLAEVPTQKQAAILLNVGERTIRRAREVLDEGTPELIEKVERGEVSVSAAAEVARLPESEQREIVARGEKEILAAAREIGARKFEEKKLAAVARTHNVEFKAQALGKFAVIYADPPWKYESPTISGLSRRTENHYPTMGIARSRRFSTTSSIKCIPACGKLNCFPGPRAKVGKRGATKRAEHHDRAPRETPKPPRVRNQDGRMAEIFLSAERAGTPLEAIARDAAILASIAFQHGVDLETIRSALTRDHDDGPATAIGAALDALAEGGQ